MASMQQNHSRADWHGMRACELWERACPQLRVFRGQIDYSSDVERAHALVIEAALPHKRVLHPLAQGAMVMPHSPTR